jgi:hypothetical protein
MPDGGRQPLPFPALTKRWEPMREHPEQLRWWNTPTRFNTVPAGRRSGKTELLKRKVAVRAIRGTRYDDARFFLGAPTREQAKRIFWRDMKRLIPTWMLAGSPSESELVIRLKTDTEIHIVGLDKPERIEGSPWDGGGVDEIANTKPEAWMANIRPALSDRKGWCDLIGVPEGRNHYYDLHLAAEAMYQERGNESEWGAFHWLSADILDADEIAAAKRDLDELTFQQEYEASFVTFEGRAYYPFDRREHCAPLKYDPKQPLMFCFDFNVAPGTASICQEQVLPGQYHRDSKGIIDLSKPVTGTGVIGEVYIERNSNTPAVCNKLIKDWGHHTGRVICYGDATGGAEGSAKVKGSDWALIEQTLAPQFGPRLSFDVPQANPRERARVNAMNSRLKTTDGTVRMMVDMTRAPEMVKDLEGVALLKGGSGEIDKKIDPKRTHLTDGLGYYIERMFPVSGEGLSRVRLGGA